jgi:hypothetical protein
VHDYLQYIPGWTARPDQPITSFDGNSADDPNNVKVYGSAVWNKWLDQRYGQDVVRNAWEDSVSAASFAPRAYDTAIRQHGGSGFSSEFSQFAAATAEWQAQNSGFPDGGLYPDVSRAGSLGVDATPGTIRMDHTTYAIVDIPLSSAPRIRLAMAAPSGTSAAVALVGLTGGSPGGTLVRTERIMPNGGKATITFDNPGNLSRLSAVLVNADVKNGGRDDLGDYSFKRDNQLYYAHASTDFKAPTVKGGTATRHKLAVTFSEKVLGVTSKSLKISGVSAKLKFTPGSKKATLTPRAAFKSGRRYTVKFTSAITDLTFNKLKAITLTFKAP